MGVEEHVCDCPCHSGAKATHFMPCCTTCSGCGKRIKNASRADHAKICTSAGTKKKGDDE